MAGTSTWVFLLIVIAVSVHVNNGAVLRESDNTNQLKVSELSSNYQLVKQISSDFQLSSLLVAEEDDCYECYDCGEYCCFIPGLGCLDLTDPALHPES